MQRRGWRAGTGWTTEERRRLVALRVWILNSPECFGPRRIASDCGESAGVRKAGQSQVGVRLTLTGSMQREMAHGTHRIHGKSVYEAWRNETRSLNRRGLRSRFRHIC